MNKTEILNIVNEPSKHIQIVKIDGKDNIVYSSKFVELLELIPTMLTKDDMVAMLTDMKDELKHCEITGLWKANYREGFNDGVSKSLDAIQAKINELKIESEEDINKMGIVEEEENEEIGEYKEVTLEELLAVNYSDL